MGCPPRVEAILVKVAGVKRAKVDNKTKRANVVYDAGKTTPAKIIAAFNKNDKGYKASVTQSAKKS
jgi:copper chaperone CopZ